MKRSFFVSFLVSSIALAGAATFTACGGDNSSGGGDSGTGGDSMAGDSSVVDTGHPMDSGHPDGGGMDTGVMDTGTPTDTGTPPDTGVDSGMPPAACLDAGSVPGTQLAAGNFVLQGVTSDGFAIYTDNATPPNVWSASLTGTPAPSMFAQVTANPFITVTGTTALIYAASPSAANQITSLGVWNSANGYHVAAQQTIAGDALLSSDGSQIIFVGNVPLGGKSGDIIVNDTTFANNGTTVVSGVVTDQTVACNPRFTWAGPAASATPVASYCLAGDAGAGGPDGAPPGATLSKFTKAGMVWNTTTLYSNVLPAGFNADNAGNTVFVPDTLGNGLLIPLNGSPATTIDTNVGFGGVVSPDGSRVVYGTTVPFGSSTSINSIKESPSMTPAPITLFQGTMTNNVVGFFTQLGLGFSPDFNWMYFFELTNMAGNLTDLHLIDTTTANQTPTDFAMLATATLFGSGWTQNSGFALWYDSVDFTTGFGVFHINNAMTKAVVPLPAPANTHVWNSFALGTTGAKVAYNDNGLPGASIFKGTADIESIDLSVANPTPTKAVAGADVNFFPSADGTQLAYTYSCSMPTQGLYVVATP